MSDIQSISSICTNSTEELSGERDYEARIPARAKYDFTAQTEKEYSLNKGQSVVVTKQIDKNWYVVESVDGSKSGLVPAAYLEDISSSPTKPMRNGLARAKFDYVANTEKEISFTKGDEIILLEKVDENWYKGRSSNGIGILPAPYVDVESEPQRRARREEALIFPRQLSSSARRSHYSLSSNDSEGAEERERKQRAAFLANSVVGSISSLQNKERAAHHEDLIDRAEKEEFSRLEKEVHLNQNPPSPPKHQESTVAKNPNPNIAGSKLSAADVERLTKKYQVMFSFDATNDDELSLLPGDTVEVVERCEDGWYVGTCKRTGAFGTFPGNHVALASG